MGTYHDIDIARYIDHALLNPAATSEQLKQCCHEGWQYNFPTVCVYPSAVREAREYLQKKPTQVCTVIGFPTGATTTASKLHEALEAVENGATELDVVINLGWMKQGDANRVNREIAQVCEETGQTIKAIIEMGLLNEEEKTLAVEACLDAGVTFIKTNTGWFGGATVEDVALIYDLSKGQIGIKAAGGIRNLESAIALIEAGATRLGTSRGVRLLQQQEKMDTPEELEE